jgi:hypothetical protein
MTLDGTVTASGGAVDGNELKFDMLTYSGIATPEPASLALMAPWRGHSCLPGRDSSRPLSSVGSL